MKPLDAMEVQMLKGALQMAVKSLERKLFSAISDGLKAAYRAEVEALRKLMGKLD